ncbi:odorant receptor 131-2-like [Phyllobates terribilis]|uniref:odorant receptor 131-2-like n=1 Tax=Phyllobates terribilis TaxID=111132 RepID=UPI003CCA808D
MVNVTEISFMMSSQTIAILRTILYTLMLLSFCVFIYFTTIILYVFFTSPRIREDARYMLFIHMLINDALMIFVLTFIQLMYLYIVYIPVPICYALITFASSAFKITPYNLAIMSLERHFAICYPLRHAEVCTLERSFWAIGGMWLVGLAPQLIDFIALYYAMPNGFFSTNLLCIFTAFRMTSFQITVKSVMENGTFVLVGLVILYTYIQIMVVARKIGSGRSSAFKAEKTVLLHALQLGLCLMCFTSAFTDAYLRKYFYVLPLTNHFLFLHIPRIISPLIYGVRDEVFRKHMRRMNFSS